MQGVVEELSHSDRSASRIVSAFVVGDGDNEPQTQCEENDATER
jgi:hypothetical protein